MIRRILFFIIAFAAILVITSLAAKRSEAVVTGSSMQVIFDNYGVIDVPVSYAYKDANGYFYASQSNPDVDTVPAGTTNFFGYYFEKNGSFNEPVEVWWSIPCYDPFTAATSTRFPGDPIVSYSVHVDVSCPVAPTGLTGSCDASNNLSFSWNNTVHTQYDVNVNDTIDGEGGPTDTYHLKTAANSYSRSGQAGRTYTWWVHTLYNSIWSASTNGNTITCAAAATPPPEPTRNTPTQVCNGSLVNVTFSWNTVSGASAYRLDIWDPNGTWTGNSHEGGGSTGWAYQDTGSSTSWTWNSFPSNSGQTWTARAYRDGLWSDIATWTGFTTITCIVETPTLTANPSCPFATLQVQFNWTNVANETGYTLEVSTGSGFGTKGTRDFGTNVTSFSWSSGSTMTSGSPLSPAFSTTYYSRVRAYNGSVNGSYSTTTSFTTPASTACSPPKVKLTVFADQDADGVYDGSGEDFNNGINPAFSSSVATIVQVDNSIDTDITSGGTNPISVGGTRTGDVTAGTFAYYKITVASGWVLTKYNSDKLPLASPNCSANPCAYSALSPPTTGRWISAVNEVWDLKLGVRATTSTMNVTVFYDKDSDGNYDSGETFNSGGNPGFSSGVATVSEWTGSQTLDRTSTLTPGSTYSTTVEASTPRMFHITPSAGWGITKFKSDRATKYGFINDCAANTPCPYLTGTGSLTSATNFYTTYGGETFNFWLGINTLTPANPGAGPPGTGDCDGTTLSVTLKWKDNATFETGYYLEVYSNSSYSTLVGTKTFAANVASFTWKNPGVASEKLDNGAAPAYYDQAKYYWRIQARNYSSTSAWVYPNSNGTGQLSPSTNPIAMPASSECTPPADPTNLVVSPSCSSGIITVSFSFTDNATNESGYILDVSTGGTSSSWASTWGGKYLNAGSGGAQTFVWKNTSIESDLLSFPDSDPNTTGNQIAPDFGKTYRWRVVAYNIRGIQSNHIYPANTTTPTGTSFATPSLASCSPPPALSGLGVTPSCIGAGNRETQLSFAWNKETSAVDYVLDVSTSSNFPTLASKVIAQPVSGSTVTFVWNETGAGNAMDSGTPLRPTPGTVYYWRVQGRNANGSGSYTLPTPAMVTAFVCIPDIDITITTSPPWSFEQNTPVTITYTLTNNSDFTRTLNLGFWPEGPGTRPPLPTCPSGSPAATFNVANEDQNRSVTIAARSSSAQNFSFTTNNQPATYIAYAYASYDCAIGDSNWNNNEASQAFSVFARTWFETQGGDVGARNGTISVSRSGKVVSSHMVVAPAVDVSAGGTWKLSGYNKPLFPTGTGLASTDSNVNGRVYDYFYENTGREAEKLTPNCNISSLGAGINYCNGGFTYTGQSLPAGNIDWFINGDLRINSNLALPSTSSMVFLVSGDVYIDNAVTQADGVYVVGQIFRTTRTDDDNMAAATLEIRGAVYGKDIRLGRILNANNDTNPAERIIFDPKYYLLHSPYLGKPTVAWTEPKP